MSATTHELSLYTIIMYNVMYTLRKCMTLHEHELLRPVVGANVSVFVLGFVCLHSDYTACHSWRGTADGICHVEIIKVLKTDGQWA